MTTTNNDDLMSKVDDVLKKAKNLLGEKKFMSSEELTQNIEDANGDEKEIAYWNNVWKQCDKFGTTFSARMRKKFHDQIDIDLDEAKKLLWDIIRHLEPDFEFNEWNKVVLNDLIYYFTGNPKFSGDLAKGIYLYGKPGSGKTFILSCFMTFASQLNYRKFRCYVCEEVAMKLKNNIDLIDDYTNYPAMLDDLMREKKVNNYGDTIDTMRYIMTVRERKQVVTHATSNRKKDDIPKFYADEDDIEGVRIGSRVESMFNFIYLHSDKDYRTWKK